MSTTISPLAVVQATAVAALDLFLRNYSDFVALFDGEELAKAIQAELAFAGVSARTKSAMTIENFFQDIERLTYDLLERGALRNLQRFGITPEAQAQINRLQASARGIPRGATGGSRATSASDGTQEPVSKWASLTNESYNRMSAAEVRTLRKTDPSFVAAVDRLAEEEAAKAPAQDSTGRVFLKRADGHFFQEWKYGQSVWTPSFDSRAHMDYGEAHRIITILNARGILATAHEMGNGLLINVAPNPVAPVVESTASEKTWRFEPTGLETIGQNQRRHRPGTFLLKADNLQFVASIDDANCIIKTVRQAGNARGWTSREAAIAAAESFPLFVQLCRHDGTPA